MKDALDYLSDATTGAISGMEALNSYAQQQSIEFAEWKDKYFKTTYPINRKMYTLKYYSHIGDTGSTFGTHYNLPELYEIFTKSKITYTKP